MRLLSWNIQWGRGIDGRVDLARTATVMRGHAVDVLCLQEVARFHPGLPGAADEDQVARLTAAFAGFEVIYGIGSDLSDGSGGRRQFGNLILSRFPVLQTFRHLLPWPPDAAVPSMQRVAVEAVVAAPFGPLRIVTCHLEYYSATQRMAQVAALRQLQVDGHRHAMSPRAASESDPPFAVQPRGEFAVFCGDFNSSSDSPEHQRIQAPVADDVPPLVDAWTIAHPGVANAPTALGGKVCCDYFFVSANLAGRVGDVRVDGETTASDHQSVVMELRDGV